MMQCGWLLQIKIAKRYAKSDASGGTNLLQTSQAVLENQFYHVTNALNILYLKLKKAH